MRRTGFSSNIENNLHRTLLGLENDDHLQYHNDERGDIRYLSVTDISTSLEAGKVPKCDINGNLNFAEKQAVSFVIENRISDPASPAVGQIWFRTDL